MDIKRNLLFQKKQKAKREAKKVIQVATCNKFPIPTR
jgi:hypothetical protein